MNRYKNSNGIVRKKLGIKGKRPSEPQSPNPVSPSVQFNPNIGLGAPIQINTGGGNPMGGKLPPPKPKQFPNPLEAKGLDTIPDSPPLDFVRDLQKQKQLDPLTGKKYTLDQTRIQSQGLNRNNFITMGFFCTPVSSGTQDFIANGWNTSAGSVTDLKDYITFGDYYNILGIEVSLLDWSAYHSVDVNGEAEFYIMQLGAQDPTSAVPQLFAKVPTGIQNLTDNTSTTFTNSGPVYGYQRIRASLAGNTFYNFAQNPINAPRSYGLALSGLWASLDTSINTFGAVLSCIVYLDKSTAGQNL